MKLVVSKLHYDGIILFTWSLKIMCRFIVCNQIFQTRNWWIFFFVSIYFDVWFYRWGRCSLSIIDDINGCNGAHISTFWLEMSLIKAYFSGVMYILDSKIRMTPYKKCTTLLLNDKKNVIFHLVFLPHIFWL